jgi:hypothetical protein
VCCLGDTVLLEGAVNCVAGEEGLSTEGFVGLLAERALQAGAVDPLFQQYVSLVGFLKDLCSTEWGDNFHLNTSIVTDLNILNERSECNNDTRTFVPADKWQLGCQRPVTVHSMEISVADTRVLDVDENFIWTWFLDWDLLVNDGCKGLVFQVSEK